MTQPRAAAVFIFNHKFEKNLPKLDAIYASRFAHRQFIMPFATSTDPRVLRIAESSWNFSGHVAQAGARIVRDGAITHYAFISDDLVLNPEVNQDNLADLLRLAPSAGYIKSLTAADAVRYGWPWAGEAAMSIRKFGRGFDWRHELPPADEAQKRFEAMGLRFPFPRPNNMAEVAYSLLRMPRRSPWAFAMGLGVTGRRADYPILCGYADFFVVPADALDRFVHYCGVFAAMNVFAEVAIPTSLALAVDQVVTELPLGEFFMKPVPARPGMLRGMELWDPDEIRGFADKHGHSLARLRDEFDPDWLYVHPVKISGWS